MTPAKKQQQIRVSVADYITQQIAMSGKPQKEIAEELNYDKPNIITMFKQGKTKVPLNKVPMLAKSLGVDPVHFLRIVLLEYAPEIWEVLDAVVGREMITENERKILGIIRNASQGYDILPQSKDDELALATVIGNWRDRYEALIHAAQTRTEMK